MEPTVEVIVRTAVAPIVRAEAVTHPDDLALARRAVGHDENAWREIYDRTRGRLFALLVYHTADREEALELLQETYLCALKSLARYRGTGPLEAYFAVIAIRRARDWKRRLFRWRRRRRLLEEAAASDEVAGVGYVAPDRPHLRLRLQRALSRLGERQRTVFLLRELEGFSFREIGGALGCHETTVRVHFFRARQTMKRLLGEYGQRPEKPPDERALRTPPDDVKHGTPRAR